MNLSLIKRLSLFTLNGYGYDARIVFDNGNVLKAVTVNVTHTGFVTLTVTFKPVFST